MEDKDKAAFLMALTKHGLDHTAQTQDTPGQDGKMSHDKKLAFVAAMAKNGLQHFAQGGQTMPAPQQTPAGPTSSAGFPGSGTNVQGPNSQGGGIMKGIAGPLTAQNQYNAQLAPTDYTSYGSTIDQAGANALSGYGNFQGIQNQQEQTADQLQGIANGTGPNPALAQLNQTTGANTAATAALMAGQRGASSNPGLIARQAAQQGAANQQTAVGQGATLAAQQQLTGLGQLTGQEQNIAGNNVSEQGANNSLFGGAATAQNAQNNTNVANYGMAQGINAQVAQSNANALNKTGSNIIQGIGSAAQGLSSMMGAKGGKITRKGFFADGGPIVADTSAPNFGTPNLDSGDASQGDNWTPPKSSGGGGGGSSMAGLSSLAMLAAADGGQVPQKKDFSGVMSFLTGRPKEHFAKPQMSKQMIHPMPQQMPMQPKMASGGKVPAMVSPGEKYLTPRQAQGVLQGKVNPMEGETIPGKPKVKGNSYANDVVPKELEEGGCIIPNKVLQGKDPMRESIKFVHAHMKKMAHGGKVKK